MKKYMFSLLLLIFSTACFSQTIFDNSMMNVNMMQQSVITPSMGTQSGSMLLNINGQQNVVRYNVNNVKSRATRQYEWQRARLNDRQPTIIYPHGNGRTPTRANPGTRYYIPNYRQ